MKNKMKLIITTSIILISLLIASTLLVSQDKKPPIDVDEVMKEVEDKLTPEGDFSAEITIVQTDPSEQTEEERTKVQTGVLFRKDDEDKFLFLFSGKDTGKGYLYIDKNLWFYDKEGGFTKKTLSDNISGDSKSRDIGKSTLTEDFEFSYAGKVMFKGIRCYAIRGKAKVKDIAYPFTEMLLRADNHLPLVRKEYSANEDQPRLAQVIYYQQYKEVVTKEGKSIYVAEKTLIENKKENTSTNVFFDNFSLKDLESNIFTKSNLKMECTR